MGHRTDKLHTPPMRRCVGCMQSRPKEGLLRIALADGIPQPDPAGTMPGRGIYLCRDEKCIAAAKKKNAVQRGFRKGFDRDMIDSLFEQIGEITKNEK